MMNLCKGTAFTLIAVVMFCMMNYFYEQSSHYRSIEGLYRYEDMPDDLELINFGSSHAEYGIDYSVSPNVYNSFNFALSSQALEMDNALLKTYAAHLKEGCVVLITISTFSLYFDAESLIEGQYGRYYRILPYRLIPGSNVGDWMQYRAFPIVSSQKNVFQAFAPRSEPVHILPLAPTEKSYFVERGIERANGHKEYLQDGKSERQINALKEMIDLCYENGWEPVLISTPVTFYYDTVFSEGEKEQISGDLQELMKCYPSLQYFDYGRHPSFYTDPEMFIDADHLNQMGREVFSKILFSDLEAYGYLRAS